MEKLRKLYADYIDEAYNIRKKAPVFAGIFGLGDDPRKNPCHEAFFQNASQWLQDFVTSEPSEAQAMEAATFILEEPRNHEGAEGYWFLYVCIGFIRELIPFMNAADCKALAVRFNNLYPRRDRMPLQQETFKLLQKAGK